MNYNLVRGAFSFLCYGGTATIANSRETFNIASVTFNYNNIQSTVVHTYQGKVFIGTAATTPTTIVYNIYNNKVNSSMTITDNSPNLVPLSYITVYGELACRYNFA
jgi:hypothetical protein